MALPLIAAIIVGATAIHQSNKSHYRKIEHKRRFDTTKYDTSASPEVCKMPSDTYSSDTYVKPKAGSVVCCEVYNALDHTGIWIDDETIVELSNSGLVKAVSAQRFLQERSGEHLFVACNSSHTPIIVTGCEQRAINKVFSYREYDVIDNNCHRFVNYCLSGIDSELTTFSKLNKQLAKVSKKNIYWDKVKVVMD